MGLKNVQIFYLVFLQIVFTLYSTEKYFMNSQTYKIGVSEQL